MKLEIIRNYLSLEEPNLSDLQIKNRKIQNRNLDIMADSILEKHNTKQQNIHNLKRIITLTANEFETTSIETSDFLEEN